MLSFRRNVSSVEKKNEHRYLRSVGTFDIVSNTREFQTFLWNVKTGNNIIFYRRNVPMEQIIDIKKVVVSFETTTFFNIEYKTIKRKTSVPLYLCLFEPL